MVGALHLVLWACALQVQLVTRLYFDIVEAEKLSTFSVQSTSCILMSCMSFCLIGVLQQSSGVKGLGRPSEVEAKFRKGSTLPLMIH